MGGGSAGQCMPSEYLSPRGGLGLVPSSIVHRECITRVFSGYYLGSCVLIMYRFRYDAPTTGLETLIQRMKNKMEDSRNLGRRPATRIFAHSPPGASEIYVHLIGHWARASRHEPTMEEIIINRELMEYMKSGNNSKGTQFHTSTLELVYGQCLVVPIVGTGHRPSPGGWKA